MCESITRPRKVKSAVEKDINAEHKGKKNSQSKKKDEGKGLARSGQVRGPRWGVAPCGVRLNGGCLGGDG